MPARPPDPPDLDRAAWKRRQDALGLDFKAEVLTPHEVRFVEAFLDAGLGLVWVPRDPKRRPTHDFRWRGVPGKIRVEVKRPEPNALDVDAASLYTRSARLIRRAVQRAVGHETRLRGGRVLATPVKKEYFILDLDERVIPDGFLELLARYNADAAAGLFVSRPIKGVWVMSAGILTEVTLQ